MKSNQIRTFRDIEKDPDTIQLIIYNDGFDTNIVKQNFLDCRLDLNEDLKAAREELKSVRIALNECARVRFFDLTRKSTVHHISWPWWTVLSRIGFLSVYTIAGK